MSFASMLRGLSRLRSSTSFHPGRRSPSRLRLKLLMAQVYPLTRLVATTLFVPWFLIRRTLKERYLLQRTVLRLGPASRRYRAPCPPSPLLAMIRNGKDGSGRVTTGRLCWGFKQACCDRSSFDLSHSGSGTKRVWTCI